MFSQSFTEDEIPASRRHFEGCLFGCTYTDKIGYNLGLCSASTLLNDNERRICSRSYFLRLVSLK